MTDPLGVVRDTVVSSAALTVALFAWGAAHRQSQSFCRTFEKVRVESYRSLTQHSSWALGAISVSDVERQWRPVKESLATPVNTSRPFQRRVYLYVRRDTSRAREFA
jgi:hypothetical protein